MKYRFLFLSVLLLVSCGQPAPKNAGEILERSITYHDPDGKWKDFQYELNFLAHLPDSTKRRTTIELDHPRQYFRYLRQSDSADLGVIRDSCFAVGRDTLDCKAISRTRDYYTYLWGLPMKLNDPGTDLDPDFTEATFEGKPVYRLKVTYPREVYYFSFDKETFKLIGEEFYKDEGKNIGEKMIRNGEIDIDGIKLPRTRAWYNTHDSLYLATDELIGYKKLE